jgi:hypothetical protein
MLFFRSPSRPRRISTWRLNSVNSFFCRDVRVVDVDVDAELGLGLDDDAHHLEDVAHVDHVAGTSIEAAFAACSTSWPPAMLRRAYSAAARRIAVKRRSRAAA